MNRHQFLYIILLVVLLLSACSNQGLTPTPQSEVNSQLPTSDSVYILAGEDELKEKLMQSQSRSSYGIEYYYRPQRVSDFLTLKNIKLDQYNVTYTYADETKKDDIEYSFIWRFSQRDGDACLKDSIDRLGYVYVYPDNPIEGVKYVSDLNRDEAKKAGRNSWYLYYSVNGVLFSASVPWQINDEDITKYLVMEKVPLN